MKTCSKCGAKKRRDKFPPGSKVCKVCKAAYRAQWRRDHPDHRKKWPSSHPSYTKRYAATRREKDRLRITRRCTPRCGGAFMPFSVEEEERLRLRGDTPQTLHGHSADCPSRHAMDVERDAIRVAAGLRPFERKPRTEPHTGGGHRIAAETDTKDEDTIYHVWNPGSRERVRLTKDDIAGMAYFAGILPVLP